jgi:hypothetical protein
MSSSCCGKSPEEGCAVRILSVDLLYLDRDVCTRCRGADETLDAAVASATPALRAMGIALEVRRTLVDSEEAAERLRLITSPTIRIDDRDIAPLVEESACESCGDLMTSGSVDCRVWLWRGEQYTSPPEGLIVEALMRAALAPREQPPVPPSDFALPENLRSFFKLRKARAAGAGCR